MEKKAISRIMVSLLLIGMLTLAFNIQQVKAQEEGLIAYYPFNGNANDESGNNHKGIVIGATLATDRFGNPNSAYSFDGSNDYVEIPHDADFDFGAGAFTVSAWIKTNAITTWPNRDEILSKGDATISGFAISMEDNKAVFFVGPSGEFWGSSVLNDGEWHHIVGTRDDSGRVMLYVDGTAESTGINIENVDTDYSLFIGKHGTMSEAYFDGLIDDVRIYNRAVAPGMPVASFTYEPSAPYVGDAVIFDASVSYDPDGTIVSYAWDFGDGISTTGMIVNHAYSVEGTFTTILTVTDNDGLTDSATVDITVIQRVLSIKLSGEHDYLFMENVKIRVAALVTDTETMEPVSGTDVTIEIYDPKGNLWISESMTERFLGTGVYEWESTKSIRRLMTSRQLRKGVYLVRAQVSCEGRLMATDILEFHIDPPSEEPIQSHTILLFVMVGALVAVISLWYIDHRRLARKHYPERNA